MDYTRFGRSRQSSWDEFERRLQAARDRPRTLGYAELEELAFRYRQILHDHALAAARFPGTALARRLHRLALEGTHWLQREAGERLPNPMEFITRSFPRAFRRTAGPLGVSVGLFLVAALFGLFLAALEPGLGAVFLPQEAFDGLREGRLWTENFFSVVPGATASSLIATNNMSVAITGWAGGAVAGLGGLYVILLNGFMLGVVIAVTQHYSMAGSLLEFIAAHGPLEITLILVTAAAGLDVGRALVIASDRPRAELLRKAGRNALVVLTGCLPWIILAGFVESFISPAPELSPAAKAGVGLLLWIAFLFLAINPLMPERES